MSLDPAKPKSLIEAGWLLNLHPHTVRMLANHVQVTVGDKARFYSLNKASPIVVDEIDQMSWLIDAE